MSARIHHDHAPAGLCDRRWPDRGCRPQSVGLACRVVARWAIGPKLTAAPAIGGVSTCLQGGPGLGKRGQATGGSGSASETWLECDGAGRSARPGVGRWMIGERAPDVAVD